MSSSSSSSSYLSSFPNFDTLVLHADSRFKPLNSHVWPIFQSSTFDFDNHEHARKVLTHETEGFCYTRSNNPNTLVLEKMIAALEGGEDCVVFASGMAATTTFLLSVLKSKDHLIIGNVIYGNTTVFTQATLVDLGIIVSTIDTTNLEETKKAITPSTRIVYLETPANPTSAISDIQGISEYAHKVNKNIIVLVDSTLASPYNQLPLKLGADVVLHSTTKYINGHTDSIGGALIYRSKELAALVRNLRSNLGGCISPFEAWLQLRGLRTFPIRMRRHNENGTKVALYLHSHPQVKYVYHPCIDGFPNRDVALRQMRNDALGSCFSFTMVGGYAAATKFLSNLKLLSLAVSLGSIDTLIEHPASMTHHDMDEAQLAAAGLSKDLIRISVGLEDVEDIIADLKQSLDALDNK